MSPGTRIARSRWWPRAVSVVGIVAGTCAAMVAAPAVAGATNTVTTTPTATNNVLVGGGAQVTYQLMQQLDDLYESAPGCTIVVDNPSDSNPQPLDYSCIPSSTKGNLVDQAPAVGTTLNPWNDTVAEEPPIGSTNGILQLESSTGSVTAIANKYAGGSASYNVFTGLNFVRDSRATSSKDDKGLNFVAYAENGVDWIHYTTIAKKATPSSGVTLLSQSELQGIWAGKITNWDQIGGTNAPIIVFSPQEGSGVWTTWDGFVSPIDPSGATSSTQAVNCFNTAGETLGSVNPGGSASCAGPILLPAAQLGGFTINSLPQSLQDPTASTGYNLSSTVASDSSIPSGVTANVTGDVVTLTKTYTGAYTAPSKAAPIAKPASITNWWLGYSVAAPVKTSVTGTGSSKAITYTQAFTLNSWSSSNTASANAVLADSIYVYPSGVIDHDCAVTVNRADSPAACAAGTWTTGTASTTNVLQLGQIGGAAAYTTGESVIPAGSCAASTNPVEDPNPCLPTEGSILSGAYPVPQYAYNVYSNGSQSPVIPAATGATLNYVSETGFLCTPFAAGVTDSSTGVSYRSDIESAILNAGFYPLYQWNGSAWASQTFDEGHVAHPADTVYAASSTDPNGRYTPFVTPSSANTATSGDPLGYCQVTSTDSGGHVPAAG